MTQNTNCRQHLGQGQYYRAKLNRCVRGDVPLTQSATPCFELEDEPKQDHYHDGPEGANEQSSVIIVVMEEAVHGQPDVEECNGHEAASHTVKCLWEGHIVDGVRSASEDLISCPDDFALGNKALVPKLAKRRYQIIPASVSFRRHAGLEDRRIERRDSN